MSARSETEQLNWSRSELLYAMKENQIAGIAAVGLTVQFVLKPGDRRGVLVQHDGATKRFRCDLSAWRFIESLKEKARNG